MNRREIKKNRITFKIWTAVPRIEKYKIGAAAQILETIRFILFINERSVKYVTIHITRAQPLISVTDHWRILSYVCAKKPADYAYASALFVYAKKNLETN